MKTKLNHPSDLRRSEPRFRYWPSLLALLLAGLGLASASAADLTWNNGASTGNWNTNDANWTGSTWNNSTPDNAIFNNLNATVTLTEAITGGSLTYNNGGAPSGAHELILTGTNLSLGGILSWGGYNAAGGGGGVDNISQAYSQRLRFQNITVTNSGNATARRGMLYLLGATLNVGGAIDDTDAWSVFRADNSTVTTAGGIDFSIVASQVELYGGTVTTPFVKVGDAAFNGTGGLFMGSGVTLVPTGGSTDYLQVFVNGDTNNRAAATITGGGMTINTAYAVTNITVLNGAGGLTKTGNGTLTLTAQNNYTGGTTVSGGMLVLASGAWTLNNVGGSGVTVSNNATLRATGIANQLNGLTLNNGTVEGLGGGHGDWGDFFLNNSLTAAGTSSLNADIALRGTSVTFDVETSGTLNVGGVLHNGADFGSNAGTPSTVVKAGTGAMVLSAANTYTGATTVSNGTLVVNGSLSGSSAVTVWGGALGGSGTVGGAVTLKSGANLLAGTAGVYGTNTLSSTLLMESGAICTLDVGTVYNGDNDRVNVTGAVQLVSTAFHIKAPSALANLDVTGDYVLMTGSSITGTPTLVWDVQPANGSQFRVVNTGTQVVLQYVPNFLVAYNANGGINPPVDNTSYPSNTVVTVQPAGSMSRVGHTFAGWNTAAGGGGTAYSPGNTFPITASTTLYAQWTVNQYTATYVAGVGGTISGTATQTVNYGTSTTPVTATPGAGYRFTGWSDAVSTATRSDTNFTANFTVTANFDNNLTWNNGAGTTNWNTTDANWTGIVWNNSASDNAFFTSVGGTISLTEPITAGSVNVGTTSLNLPNTTFTNGTLSAASLTVQGKNDNGGNYSSNATLTLAVPTVSVAGDVAVGRANLVIASGIVTANRIISAAGSADWADVVINGGTVTATNGVDGSVNSGATFQLDLNGGSLFTPFITVADREVGTFNNAWLTFNGTVVHATANTNTFITLYGGNQNTYVGNGGAKISTDGNDIGIGVNLVAAGTGGLTKTGNGTLTLTGTNTYTGKTAVQGGVLSIGSTVSLGGGPVNITNAVMNLNYSGTIQVGSLTLNGVAQPDGTYGATGSGAVNVNDTYFTGTGVLNVLAPTTIVWDNNAGTFNWNTTDDNWSSYLWNNSGVDSAIFNGAGAGTVSLQQSINAANVSKSSAAGYVLNGNGNSLQVAGDFSVQGSGTGQPGLTLSNGVFNLNRVITHPSAGDWGVLNIASGATVTVTNGIDGSVGTPYTFALKLNGGTLTTPSIKVADLHQPWGNSFLTFNGTEVIAAADSTDFIQTYGDLGNNYSVTVDAGGAILNTAGHNVTVNPGIIGTGGLIKKGTGTLTLVAFYAGPTYGNLYPGNTYTGNTVVQGGVLSIGSIYALGSGFVEITNGATMDLNYGGAIQVAGLKLNGVTQPYGTHGATGSGATFVNDTYFTGTGVLNIAAPPALSYVSSGGNLTFTWTGSGSLEWQTNALSKGLGTNWVAYPNGTNGVTVPVDVTKGSVFFRVKQ